MMDILKEYNVSRETVERLKLYESLVLEWNNKFNLISKSSVECIWNRHILDSVQLCKYINNKDNILYDFGSGAGFPAIVIAIMAQQFFSNLQINLIESIGKKAQFLNVVKSELGLDVEIICDRIENINIKNVDVITSRALANLSKLLEYSYPFCSKKTKLIFPKGNKWNEELELAQKKWVFEYNKYDSITDANSKIFCISKLRRK